MLLVASPLLILMFFLCVWLVRVLACFSLGLSCMGFLLPIGLDYFLFHIGEIFNYNLFTKFLIPFHFLFFFWDSYNSNVGTFDIVLGASETVLSSVHSFYFILLFRSYFHHFIIHLTDSFFCFRYSAIDSFYSIFNFSNCVVCLCMFIL